MNLKTREMILVALFAALTAIGAFITIPLPFVPFTLQFFFCAFAGMMLGARLGALSQLIYVAVGLAGVPIFTKGGGPGYLLQPTFGYLLGLICAAYVIGKLTEKHETINLCRSFIACLAGLAVLYLFGVPYLYLIFNLYLHQTITVWTSLVYGFFPFIGGDLVKGVIVALTACKVLPILKKAGLLASSVQQCSGK